MNPHRLHAYFLFLMVAVIWGMAGPVIKLTLHGIPADVFLLYRFFVSSVVAVVLFGKHIKFPNFKTFLEATVYSLLNVPLPLLALFWGISKTSLLHVSLISLLGPLLTILAGYFFLKDHITKREKFGIFIAFLGSMFILIEPLIKSHIGIEGLTGDLLIFLYVASSVIAGVILKKLLRQGVNAVTLANYSFIVGLVTLLPVTLMNTNMGSIISTVSNLGIWYHLGVLYMALISGNLAFSLLNLGQKTIELSEAALFMYLYPIISGLLAIFVLGDKVTTTIIIGSAITFVGVAIAEIKLKKSKHS